MTKRGSQAEGAMKFQNVMIEYVPPPRRVSAARVLSLKHEPEERERRARRTVEDEQYKRAAIPHAYTFRAVGASGRRDVHSAVAA